MWDGVPYFCAVGRGLLGLGVRFLLRHGSIVIDEQLKDIRKEDQEERKSAGSNLKSRK